MDNEKSIKMFNKLKFQEVIIPRVEYIHLIFTSNYIAVLKFTFQ